MSFGAPFWLPVAGGVLVLLVSVLALEATRRRRTLDRLGHAPQLMRMAAAVSPGRRLAKSVLLVTAVTALVVSLARPQVEGETLWRERGIDVVLAVDVSRSMLARDAYPSRLERARLAVDTLLERLAGDRVGVVVFAGTAAFSPLTHDVGAAWRLVEGLGPRELPAGSDLGRAVLTARCLLVIRPGDADCASVRGDSVLSQPAPEEELGRPRLPGDSAGASSPDRGRAIVLITDGEDTAAEGAAQVERAARDGIVVYVVGVGTAAGARVPELDAEGRAAGWVAGPDGTPHVSKLDEAALRALARAGGDEARYLPLDPRRIDVDAVVRALARLKEGELASRTVSIPSEVYAWFLFPAFLLLLLEACLSDRRRRVR